MTNDVPDRSLFYLKDLLQCIYNIEKYSSGYGREDFQPNSMVFDAVIRNLEIIGEAARNISEEIKGRYPDTPWRRVIGLRNLIAHKYFGIDPDIVWEIIQTNLPELKSEVETIISDLES